MNFDRKKGRQTQTYALDNFPPRLGDSVVAKTPSDTSARPFSGRRPGRKPLVHQRALVPALATACNAACDEKEDVAVPADSPPIEEAKQKLPAE
jgi:hypothetical protein